MGDRLVGANNYLRWIKVGKRERERERNPCTFVRTTPVTYYLLSVPDALTVCTSRTPCINITSPRGDVDRKKKEIRIKSNPEL